MSVYLIYFTHKYKRQNKTGEIARGDEAGTHHSPVGLPRNAGTAPRAQALASSREAKEAPVSTHTEDTQRRRERAVSPGKDGSQTKGADQAGRQLLAPLPGLMSYFIQFYKLVESNTVLL